MSRPTTITRVDVHDIRFPTSRERDGSDAMNPDPDYSATYVVLHTDRPDGREGHGLTFTIGRGNELCVAAVQALAAGSVTGVIPTNRGYAIATVVERRSDQVHLATILVLAPSVDLYSPQGTPAWFTKFIDDREAALHRAGKIELKVGNRAGG